MAAKAELKAKLSLSKALWNKTLKSALVDSKAFGIAAGKAIGTGVKVGLTGITAATIGAGIGIAVLTKKAYDLGSSLQDASDKTGIAVDQIMILQQAAKDNGIDDITGAIGKMQKNLVEATAKGSGPAAEALQILGLNAEELINKLPSDQLQIIGERIQAIANPALKTAEAIAIFGKSGKELLPLFADAGALGTAARSIGKQAQILRDNSQAFDKISDRLGRTGLKLQGFGVGVAAGILPAVDKITAKFDKLDLSGAGEKFAKGIEPVLDKLSEVNFDKAADSLIEKMIVVANIMAKIGALPGRINAMSKAGLIAMLRAPFTASVQRNDEDEQPKVERSYAVRPPSTFFRNADPRQAMFGKEFQGPDVTGKPLQGFNRTPLSPFGRGVDKAAIRKKEYDDLVRKYGMEAVDKMSQDQINSRPVGHGSLSSGGLSSGGLSAGGFGAAYNQTGLLRHSELRAHQNALVAAGAMGRDERTNNGGHDVIRRGDRERAKNVAKEEERKKMSLEGVNERLDKIIGELK